MFNCNNQNLFKAVADHARMTLLPIRMAVRVERVVLMMMEVLAKRRAKVRHVKRRKEELDVNAKIKKHMIAIVTVVVMAAKKRNRRRNPN